MATQETMSSLFYQAPPTGRMQEYLQANADYLVALNRIWIRAQLDEGKDPPCCSGCAEPPWCAAPLRYVPFRGSKSRDTMRAYFDGPSMLHDGAGTCIELAAYDAAAAIEKQGKPARPIVYELAPGSGDYHCIVEIDGQQSDPSVAIAERQRDTEQRALAAHNVGRACGCGG